MALVVALLATLAAVVMPNYLEILKEAKEQEATYEIQRLQRRIEEYKRVNGDYPPSLEALGGNLPLDPWGRSYRYLYINIDPNARGRREWPKGVRKDKFMVPLNTDYDLYSMGKDGKTSAPLTARASHDDIVRAANGDYVGGASGF